MAGVIGKSVPYWGAWNFVVEIDGQPVAGFQKATGIGFGVGVLQFMEGGVHGVASQSHGPEKAPPDVTLERGESGDPYFWNWRASIKSGNVDDTRTFTVAQKHGNTVVERYKLEGCALSSFETGDFDRGTEDKHRIGKIVLKPQLITREAA
jgi:phage tail-like protein